MWSTHICRSAVHHPQRNQVFPSTAGVLLMVALVTITLKVHKYWRHCQMFPTIIPILKSVRLRCNEKKKGSPRFQICLFMLILNYYVTWKVFIQKKIFWKEPAIQRKSGVIDSTTTYLFSSPEEKAKNFPNIVRTLEAGEDGSHWLDVV